MILVGIDDTDVAGSPGTNQLARRLVNDLPAGYRCTQVLRHQLLQDDRVPYTSQNGSASLLVEHEPGRRATDLLPYLRSGIASFFVAGSDPGLAVAHDVPEPVRAFGRQCQAAVVTQAEAQAVASAHGIHLEGLGGTEDGVIGALAAVGLLAGGDDGRLVHRHGWPWPDAMAGHQPVEAIRSRGVDAVLTIDSAQEITTGTVDVGKHLRPAVRSGRVVLFVEPAPAGSSAHWKARKLP